MFAVFVYSTCYNKTVSQTSEIECKIPDNSFHINHPHVNLSEEEFTLLQTEGRCFLFCVTEHYSKVRLNSKKNSNVDM